VTECITMCRVASFSLKTLSLFYCLELPKFDLLSDLTVISLLLLQPNLTDPVLRALADLPKLNRLALNSSKLTAGALGRMIPLFGTRLKQVCSAHFC
jgi:hypothetical protein